MLVGLDAVQHAIGAAERTAGIPQLVDDRITLHTIEYEAMRTHTELCHQRYIVGAMQHGDGAVARTGTIVLIGTVTTDDHYKTGANDVVGNMQLYNLALIVLVVERSSPK